MNDTNRPDREAQAYRHMAVLRFSTMVLFSSILKTQFAGKSDEEFAEFLNLTHEYITLLEKNTGGDPTMQNLIPSIEAFIDDIVSTVGLTRRK